MKVNGGLSAWSNWDFCTKQCGGGKSVRTRECNNPKPKNGGLTCRGKKQEEKNCNTQLCKGVLDLYLRKACNEEINSVDVHVHAFFYKQRFLSDQLVRCLQKVTFILKFCLSVAYFVTV